MDIIKVVVRSALLARTQLVEKIADRVSPSRSEAGENPVHPHITLSVNVQTDDFSRTNEVRVDVWSKVGNDELWSIYGEVRAALHKQPLTLSDGSRVFLCRETYVNDDLYEPSTQTHHLTAKYKLITRG